MEKFLGVPYPIVKDPKGYYHSQGELRQIKADLIILILTNPGERVMLPTFGTDLRSLIFEMNDSFVEDEARNRIINAINAWEPRVTVEQLDVTSSIDESELNMNDDKTEINHILFIRIRFLDPENITEVQELRLEVPLGG